MSIDPRERYSDPEELQRLSFEAMISEIWCAMPCIIDSFDATAGTISCQPAIMGKRTLPNGAVIDIKLPLLVDVLVMFPGGGNTVLTSPIAQGDECLVIFADRCIDAWYQSGGVQAQADLRLHDLSDGFAIIGPRSLARAIPNISLTTAQFRSVDGTVYYDLDPIGKIAKIVAPGGIQLIGNVSSTGTFTNNGVDIGSTHEHQYIPGGNPPANTTPPVV